MIGIGWELKQLDWAIDQLSRFTYKPGWRMKIKDPIGMYDDPMLHIDFKAEDTYNPGRTIPIGTRVTIPHYIVRNLDPDRFADWLQRELFKVEQHESQEWLRRDGIIYKDPHKERV